MTDGDLGSNARGAWTTFGKGRQATTSSKDAATSRTRAFYSLDALRGVAALGVIAYHMGPEHFPIDVPGGYLAVDLFFMMSGVVLSHAYESRFRSGMGTTAFMRARLIRLYPLYLLGTLLGMAVTLASLLGNNANHWDSHSFIQAAWRALLLVPSASGPVQTLFPLNMPSWSLFFEIVVNLLFVLSWPLLSSRVLCIVAAATGLTVVATVLHFGSIDQGSTASTLAIGLARTSFGFSVGIVIARLAPRWLRRESNLGVLVILALFCIAIGGWPQQGARTAWDMLCVLLVFPLLVVAATMLHPSPRACRMAVFLGLTSYAIYVLHSPLLLASYAATPRIPVIRDMAQPLVGVAALLLLLAGSWLVDRFYDTPVRRLLTRTLTS